MGADKDNDEANDEGAPSQLVAERPASGTMQTNVAVEAANVDHGRASSVKARLTDIVALELGTDASNVDQDCPFSTLGLSSIQTAALATEFGDALAIDVTPELLYRFPTITALAAHFEGDDRQSPLESPFPIGSSAGGPNTKIGVIGIGCQLPGSVSNPNGFWDALCQGRSGILPRPPVDRPSCKDLESCSLQPPPPPCTPCQRTPMPCLCGQA